MVGIKGQHSNQGDGKLLEEEMAKLPKFALAHNEKKDRWDLTKDGASCPTASFDTKSDATKGGALSDLFRLLF